MINYWWVTRPKRKLNSVPEVLSTIVAITSAKEWSGQRDLHLDFEDSLEESNLKKKGERRDQGGGGARTYMAWLKSLGLLFKQNSTGKVFLTLAGEAIIAGKSPFEVLTNQVIKYQFPSSYSLSRGVEVSSNYRIHPFWFLLKLLSDSRIRSLTQEEIAKIVITYGYNETDRCYESVVSALLRLRSEGDSSLPIDFDEKFAPGKGGRDGDPYGHLLDTANTFINWLDYTRLIVREDGEIRIAPDKAASVYTIIKDSLAFVDRPEDEEFFQRKYGLDPAHKKDTRDLTHSSTITDSLIAETKISQAFFAESLKRPIYRIDTPLVEKVSELTGYGTNQVEDILQKKFASKTLGTIDLFLANYRDMAFASREKATDFEKATVEICSQVFGLHAKHVGPIGRTPDVLVLSDDCGFAGIIDNKAYSNYSITNDHYNRMVHNYIGDFGSYSEGTTYPLSFFSYIAGGFSSKINTELKKIIDETGVSGSAMKVDNMIKLVQSYDELHYNHDKLRKLFSVGRETYLSDIC